MEDYQLRVIEEKRALDEKAYMLSNFIGCSPKFIELDIAEQTLLREQNDIMWQYSEILDARIRLFKNYTI